MAETLRVALIQNTASPETGPNVEQTLAMSEDAIARGAELVCLPEYFSGLDSEGPILMPPAFAESAHPALAAFRELAKRRRRWLLLGSLAVKAPDGRILNRGYVLDDQGAIAAAYDKIHLFDVDLGPGKVYRESATIAPGAHAVVAATPWGGLGLSICYDLRFAGLYRALAHAGASLLAVPAAFTRTTGEAHWHVLNRARAIENGAFVIAPCQTGDFRGGGAAYGHSLVVDPWGKVLADGGTEVGVVMADLDLGEVARTRARIPSLRHDRPYAASPAKAAE